MTRSISTTTLTAGGTCKINHTVNADADTASVTIGRSNSVNYTSGTTDSKFDRCWEIKAVALDSGGTATDTFDLYDLGSDDIGAGAGLDALGQSWAVAEIVGIHVSVTSGSTGELYVGGDGTTVAFNSMFGVSGAPDDTAQIIMRPGSELALFCSADPGWAVADTSNHLLKFTAVGGTATFDLTVYARSA